MPNITAKPHPNMMTGQVSAPIPTPIDLPKSPKTATHPSPKKISTIVPKNSPIISPGVPASAFGLSTARIAIDAHSFSVVRGTAANTYDCRYYHDGYNKDALQGH